MKTAARRWLQRGSRTKEDAAPAPNGNTAPAPQSALPESTAFRRAAEARRLAESGYTEIQLLGQNVNS